MNNPLATVFASLRGHKPQVYKAPTVTDAPTVAGIDRVKNMAMAIALQRFFVNRYFCICTLQTMLEAANISIDRHTQNTLRLVHCVNWADMPPELRDWVQTTIVGFFATP